VTLDAAPVIGDLYGIIDNLDTIPVAGTFLDLPQDSTFAADFGGYAYEFAISYDGNVLSPTEVTFTGGNDVVLTVVGESPVPEPSALAVLLPAVTLLGGYSARTKRRQLE